MHFNIVALILDTKQRFVYAYCVVWLQYNEFSYVI